MQQVNSRTVVSPAGESIEIVPDAQWRELTEDIAGRSIRAWYGTKPYVIRYLWEHGKVTSDSGAATGVLYRGVTEVFPHVSSKLSALSHFLKESANSLAFQRHVVGRRNYLVQLVRMPEMWYEKLQRDIEMTFTAIPVQLNGGPVPEPSAPVIEPDEIEYIPSDEPKGFTEDSPPLDIEMAQQVAMSLLTTVMEIISAGQTPPVEMQRLRNELAHSQTTLASRLEDNERFRRQLREVADELLAVKHERDGLRQQLRRAESNLSAALKGESVHAINAEINKRIDHIMREAPKPKGD
jgi:hypothetical protein